DDAPISSNFLFQTTYDFGQFELQRGPQGTLRGRASPSGSIAVTTRRPDLDEVGAVFNATIADPHARKVDGAFNIPIIEGVLAVRVAGAIDNNRGNFVHSIKESSDPANNEGPYRRTKSIRGSVRFEPTDWATFNFMAQRLHGESHLYNQVISDSLVSGAARTSSVVSGFDFTPLIGPFDRLAIEDTGTYGRQDQEIYVGNADFRFAEQKLSYVGSYNSQDLGSLAPQDTGDFFNPVRINLVQRAFPDPVGFEPVCLNEARMAGAVATTNEFYQCTHGVGISQRSHELRLASEERLLGIFDYVAGGFYNHTNSPTNVNGETVLGNVPAARGFTVAARTGRLRRASTTEKSVFGNLTAHLLDDRLELSGGLRYIDYKLRSSLAVGTPPAATALLTNDLVKQNATIYSASIKYAVTNDINLYALTGSSFRPTNPVIGDFSVGPTGVEGPSLRERAFTFPAPEKSKSYEIGAKTSFLDGRGKFNISAYYQKFKNYPFRAPGSGVFFVNYTVGAGGVVSATPALFNFVSPVPVKVKGVEAEASFQILDRWSISGNASYADGKIKGGTIACNVYGGAVPTVAQIQAAAGGGETLAVCSGVTRPVLTTPKFSANVQSEFGFDVTDTTDAFVRGLATIFGKTTGDIDNPFDQVGSYGLLNLYAGMRDKDGAWEITVFGKNILREREVLSVANPVLFTAARTPGLTTFNSQYRSVTVTAPREFGLTAKIAFGSR
ncbi:MAG: TonB-dependent receptor, partial [Rhodococcus fascians]